MTIFDYKSNRLDYGDLLKPKVGQKVRFAVGMTYSMDLEALIGVPVSLGMLSSLDSAQMKNPYFILEAINRASDRIVIFSQAGAIRMPTNIKPVYTLLERSVFSISLGHRRIFHPKLWVVEYEDEKSQRHIKLITMSRNLTFDRSFDVSVALEGKVGSHHIQANEPLAELLEYTLPFASSAKRKAIRSLVQSIRTTKFELNPPFSSFRFHAFGFKDYKQIDTPGLFGRAHSLMVISPFLSNNVIKELTAKPRRSTLITRKSSLTSDIIHAFDDVYITRDLVMGDELLDESSNEEPPPRDVHAKVYYTQDYQSKSLFIGSLNATSSAFHRNIEWMVELGFMKGRYSYERILKELIPDNESLFERLDSDSVDNETEHDGEDYLVHDIVRELGKAFVNQNDDGKYTVRVMASSVPHEAFIAPLYRLHDEKKLEQEVVFENLLLTELSAFFMIRTASHSVVVKLVMEDLPQKKRDDAIFRTIISDSHKFLAYIAFVLSDDFASIGFEQQAQGDYRGKASSMTQLLPTPLYERMLRTAAKDPERIVAVENVMERLDESVVTPDIRSFVETFKAAAVRRRKRR